MTSQITLPADGMWVIGYGSLIFKPPPLYLFRVTGTLKGFIRRFWQLSSDHRGTPENPGRVATLVSLDDLKSHKRFHNDLHLYELGNIHRETSLASDSAISLEMKTDIDDVSVSISNLSEDDLKVWGVAYYIAPEHVNEMKEYLDVREQDGYSTHRIMFHVHSVPDLTPEIERVLSKIPRNSDGDLVIESMIYIGTIDNESFVGPEDIEKTADVIRTGSGPSGANYEYLHEITAAVRNLDPLARSRDYYLEDLTQLAQPHKLDL